MHNIHIEEHPLEPFIPKDAKLLMLGSFPPKQERWSMNFFYPNWINDMWRIMGLIFFDNKHHFELKGEKKFDKDKIEKFCEDKGLALYDTAYEVRRLKDNASDEFLEVVTPTDINALVSELYQCRAIVVTGQKATDIISQTYNCNAPALGEFVNIQIDKREFQFWRMPSSSRAYPLSLDKKAECYRNMFSVIFNI